MDSNIIAALIGAGTTVAVAVVSTFYATRRERLPQPNGLTPPDTINRPVADLDSILARLERHRQRATFGAVAGFLNRQAYSLFDGYPRTRRTCWVVNQETGEPTGQDALAVHLDLFKISYVIRGSNELREWLLTHL